MRRLLRLLGNRYGVSLTLVVVVVVIVLGARGFSGGGGALPEDAPANGSAATASYEPDDGEDTPAAPVTPSTSPGAADPVAVATQFAQAWLHHDGVTAQQWYDGLAPYATKDLQGQLTGVDPGGVPASRITGAATLVPHDSAYAEVNVPVDSGLLTLRLVASSGRWLVNGVDWGRS